MKKGVFLVLYTVLVLSVIACEDEKMIDSNEPQDWTETVNYQEPFKNKIFKRLKTGELVQLNEETFLEHCQTMGQFSDIQTMTDFHLATDVIKEDGKEMLTLRAKVTRGEQVDAKQAQNAQNLGVIITYDPTVNGFVAGDCACFCLWHIEVCGGCDVVPHTSSCACYTCRPGYCTAVKDCAQP